MNESNDTSYGTKATQYEAPRDLFPPDMQEPTNAYPIEAHDHTNYSVNNIMDPLTGANRDNSSSVLGTASGAPEATPKQKSKRSWVFTQGYGKRVFDNDIMLIQCMVPGCGRVFKANRGSTSSISYHLLAAHEIPEFPGKSKRIIRKSTQERKEEDVTPQEQNEPKYLGLSALGDKSSIVETRNHALRQEFVNKEALPFQIFQDRNLLHMLQLSGMDTDKVVLLTPEEGSSKIVNKNLVECRRRIKELLEKQDSLSLSISNCSGFILVMVHFLDDQWATKEAILCMLDLKEVTTGAAIARSLMETLDIFQICSKIFTITTDFSPPMLVLVDELHRISASRNDFEFAPHQHIPCIGYIINKVINDVLQSDLEGHGAETAGISEAPPGSILAKLVSVRRGVAAIRENPFKLGRYQNHFVQKDIKYQELVLDTPGDWETTFLMLEAVIGNQHAFNSVCTSCDMMEYTLSQEDITFFDEIKLFLALFQAFSARVSSSRYPTISKVMLLYDKMLTYLDGVLPQKPAYMQKVFMLTRKLLNTYFGKGLDNYIYPIAISMDPRLKFSSWKPPIYSYEDCEFLRSTVRQYWESHFNQSKSHSELSFLPQTGFDDVFGVDTSSSPDELTLYIQDPPVASGFVNEADIWDFWKRSCQSFPHLSKMARKFLIIPVSSKPCERCLVHSKSLMPITQLSAESQALTQQFSLLRSWRALLQ